ncbi:MAG: outer membrane protein assembly factor BamC [Burkholderiaceae bacterium]
MNSRIVTPLGASLIALTVFTLAACSTINNALEGDKLDYKTQATVKVKSLEVPPDLSALPRDDRYDIPADRNTATLSVYNQQRASGAGAPVQGSEVLPAVKDAHLERAGGQRWLAVNTKPEQLWPIIKEFWQENGFLIKTESQDTGIMETDWAENRAKIPQDFIRNTIGKYLDGLYSTGERDKFRTRIERGADGGSEIYISHRGAKETIVGVQGGNTVWEPRPSDPELEAEFLRRLLVRLGADKERAKAVVAAGYVTPNAATNQPSRSKLVAGASGSPGYVEIEEPFDRAWRRVGLALDRVGFTVEDRDRNTGIYFVRYVDPDADAKDKPGLLSRIFTSSEERLKQAAQYRIAVRSQGTAITRVSVLDKDSKQVTSDVGSRILKLLDEQLK